MDKSINAITSVIQSLPMDKSKSSGRHSKSPNPSKPTLNATQLNRLSQVLESFRPVMKFIDHPDQHKVIGFLPYVIVSIAVLGLSGIILKSRWISGPLNQYVQTQYNALVQWTRKTYLNLERSKSQRELERQWRKQQQRRDEQMQAEELARTQSSQSWMSFFKDKLAMAAPHQLIRNLLDPTNKYSWGLLGSIWVQYMTGTHLPYVGSQLPFGAVATATAAKVLLFVVHWTKRWVRQEVYGDDYDPLFIRLPQALLASFLELLHYRLTRLQLNTGSSGESTDPEWIALQKEIKDLKGTQQAMANNVKALTQEELQQPVSQLAQTFESIQAMGSSLANQRDQWIQMLTQWTSVTMILPPVYETEFAGSVTQLAWLGPKIEYTDSTYYKTWILMAEYILHFANVQDDVVQTLEPLGLKVDETHAKHKTKYFQTTLWDTFQTVRTEKVDLWQIQRNALVDLRKYITVTYLEPLRQIVATKPLDQPLTLGIPSLLLGALKANGNIKDLDASLIPLAWFATPGQRDDMANWSSALQATADSTAGTLDEQNETLRELLVTVRTGFEQMESACQRLRTHYIFVVYHVFQRHILTIELCRAACQLLRYYVACEDAFDLALVLYDRNQTLDLPPSFWTSSKQFLNMNELFEAVDTKTLDNVTTVPNLTYVAAMNNVYQPLVQKQSYVSELLRSIMDCMCSIYHLGITLDPKDSGSSTPVLMYHPYNAIEIQNELNQIRTLYHVTDQCNAHTICKECDCPKVTPPSQSTRLTLPPKLTQRLKLESLNQMLSQRSSTPKPPRSRTSPTPKPSRSRTSPTPKPPRSRTSPASREQAFYTPKST